MDRTGMGEKPVEERLAPLRGATGRRRADDACWRLELAASLKRRVEDVTIRAPKSTAIRQALHAVRRATGAPRLRAIEDADRYADRFWTAMLACAAAETEPVAYDLHRIDNHADLWGRPNLGRPAAVR